MNKLTNPKDAIGSDKLPLHLWPETATALGSIALLDGALRYGRSNWRAAGVKFSIYIDALRRHANALFEGEDVDPDSGLPHLAHALACLAILVDAQAAGKLVDDRQYPGGYRKLVTELTPHVARLKALRADMNPTHYTIASPVAGLEAALEAAATRLDGAAAAALVGVSAGQDKPPAGRLSNGDFGVRPPAVQVVVGVLIRDGKVLLQRRSLEDENFPGLWECPGGGLEPGESDSAALHRELGEELGIDVKRMAVLWQGANEGYRGRRFEFRFYRVTSWAGQPKPLDGQLGLEWFKPEAIRALPLTPANAMAWSVIEEAIGPLEGGLTGRQQVKGATDDHDED